MSLEQTILKNLVTNEEFSRKVLPFLKDEYFMDNVEKVVFQQIRDFTIKYNVPPSIESLEIIIDGTTKGISDADAVKAKEYIATYVPANTKTDIQWLFDQTENFCQDKAIMNAMMNSLEIMKNPQGKLDKGSIPKLLSDALSVSFDPNVGHDYTEDSDMRFDLYHKIDEKIPFDLEFFNKITKNGIPKKTLNIILAGTGVGKSLMMCHFAASYLNAGKNVLYITLELSEEKVAERIDANLMNTNLDDIMTLSKEQYDRKIKTIKNKTDGKLIIKEYPTAGASVLHFKGLINELYLKKNFKPDVIFIDYLNICASSRYKAGAAGLYEYVKGIAEELRGLSVEQQVPIWSATQTNRAGFVSSDPGLENTSESFGLAATADFMFSVVSNEDLEKLGQYMVTQLKNRYSDFNKNKRFIVGVEKAKMRLHDVESTAQIDIANSSQINTQAKPTNSTKEKFASLKV